MGERISDKCIFCKCDLEEEYHGHFDENGERASDDYNLDLNLCKECLEKLKILLSKKSETKSEDKR